MLGIRPSTAPVNGDAIIMTCQWQGPGRPHLSYSGLQLPLKLVQPLEDCQIQNRNTYFLGFYDATDRLIGIRKMVYSEMEFEHHYRYDAEGVLIHVTIVTAEGERMELDPAMRSVNT